MFGYRKFPDRNKRLWQYFGIRVKSRPLAAGHDDNRQPYFFMLLDKRTIFKNNSNNLFI